MTAVPATVLWPGTASGTILVLDEPLSLWGGLDPATGRITDARHPQRGRSVTGRILVMRTGRGSSSSSTILAEAIRLETAPAAIILAEPDAVLVVGAIVAERLYGRAIPILSVPDIGVLFPGASASIGPAGMLVGDPPPCPDRVL